MTRKIFFVIEYRGRKERKRTGMKPGIIHILSAAGTLIFLLYWGVRSGKGMKDASAFQRGSQQASVLLVIGAVLGTMIGGAATIGTAQMAFTNGLSALWFSIGSAVGCLFLVVVGIPFRQSGWISVPALIKHEYGEKLGVLSTTLTALGMLINIAAQMVAAAALLGSLFHLPVYWSVILCILSMSAYVLFGGLRGAGILGMLKTVFLYVALIISSIIIFRQAGADRLFRNAIEAGMGIFHRGIGIDVGAALGAVLGFGTTQAYFQSIISAKDDKTARKALYFSAILLPPVGIFSTQIGLYMKSIYPNLPPGHAFSTFVLEHFPAVPAGMTIALLFFALLGTGSGMALGLSTNLTHDLYLSYFKRSEKEGNTLAVNRFMLLLSLILGGVLTLLSGQTSVLAWGFLSLGLRGMVLFAPVIGALFFRGKYTAGRMALAATLPLTVYLVCKMFFALAFDPVFIGLGLSITLLLLPTNQKIRRSTRE
jgi:SSS family solute:Na+ symporter